jgi:hypothetical protein
MGTIMFRDKRLDSLNTIRSVLDALFRDEAIRTSLGDEMWLLNQRRHLLVHRRGIIDQQYISRTGESAPLGSSLAISSFELERYILVVRDAIVAISAAASAPRVGVP